VTKVKGTLYVYPNVILRSKKSLVYYPPRFPLEDATSLRAFDVDVVVSKIVQIGHQKVDIPILSLESFDEGLTFCEVRLSYEGLKRLKDRIDQFLKEEVKE